MLRKKVKLLLEQLQVCIFAEIVFGVRCTLNPSRAVDSMRQTEALASIIFSLLLFFILKGESKTLLTT